MRRIITFLLVVVTLFMVAPLLSCGGPEIGSPGSTSLTPDGIVIEVLGAPKGDKDRGTCPKGDVVINTTAGNFTSTLSAGWNLLSTPILLDANYASLGEIFDAQSLLNISVSYNWDGTIWIPLTTDYELLPLYAIYVKVKAGGSATATFVPSEEISTLSSREVQEGLNLIGPAPALVAGDFPAMALEDALVSIKEVGNVTGYTMVVSPGLNQPGWGYPPAGEGKDLLPYKGYWVVMENGPDTLYGFS